MSEDNHIDEADLGSASEDEVSNQKKASRLDDENEEIQETAAEKRIRLAKQYLAQMEAAQDDEEGSR